MRFSTTLAFAAIVLGTDCITLAPRREGVEPRVIQHTIQRRPVSDQLQNDAARKQKRSTGTVSVSLLNDQVLYYMNATLGTPAQDFQFHIDTGSSDLWVNVASSTYCQDAANQCSAAGYYSPNKSSTYKYINSGFNISYVDGSGAAGDYVSDDMSFGGVTLDNQEFGIGYTSTSAQGVLGIGYTTIEVAATYDGGSPYANVPQHLATSGYINSDAYSLWLNDLDSSTGNILFGGVNSAKYTGDLQTIPIIRTQGVYAELIIAMTAVGMNGSTGSLASNLAYPALLDSGTSLTYIPDDIAESIYSALGTSYNDQVGAAYVPCSAANSDATVDFTFSGATISVALRELVVVTAINSRGQETCVLGIGKSGDSTPVLGDSFLRSAYVVYDLSNNEIGLAQTDFNSTATDDIREITSSEIPGATAVANPVTSVVAMTGGSHPHVTYVVLNEARPTAPASGMNIALVGAVGAGILFAL